MGDYEDVVIINEGYELRTSKSGKTRAVIKVTAEPLVHNFDPKALGAGPAMAIAAHFRARIQGITETVAAATLEYRKKAVKAFAEGKPWAMKRYAGGKIGPMAPQGADRLFNDSGRMAASIRANASSDGAYRINVAANRLTDATTGSVQRMWERLVALVPEFADPARLLESDLVKAAIGKAQKQLITKARASSSKAGLEVVMKVIELAAQVVEALDEVAA